MTTALAALAAAAAALVLGVRPGVAPDRRLRFVDGGQVQRPRGRPHWLQPPGGRWAPALLLPLAVLAGVPAPLAGAAALAAAMVLTLARRRRRARAGAERARAGVDLAHALAAELRAGRAPAAALSAVAATGGPLARELRAASVAVAAGATASAELARLAVVPGSAALGAIAAAWDVTEQVGGPVAGVLDRLAEGLEADERSRRELDAVLAGPRTTMLVLAVLPVFGVALGQSIGAHPLVLLLHRPIGWCLLGAAGFLDAVGALWVRRITVAATR